MKNYKKKVLVTGGAGFVGHHLVQKLLDNNFDVNILDDLSTGKSENINEDAIFYEGDIRNINDVDIAIKNCEYVFHLAARVELQKSIDDPYDCYSVNISGTANLINASIRNKIKNIFFASSCAVYPLDTNIALSEDMVDKGSSPYSISKLAGEETLKFYYDNFNLNFCALRCFNIYGEGQNINSIYSAVIPKFISLARQGLTLELINGGTQTRDFISVNDVTDAYLYMMKYNHVGIFNLGTGIETSIKKLSELIISIEKKSSSIDLPNRKGDAIRSFADLKKLKNETGFYTKNLLVNEIKKLYREY